MFLLTLYTIFRQILRIVPPNKKFCHYFFFQTLLYAYLPSRQRSLSTPLVNNDYPSHSRLNEAALISASAEKVAPFAEEAIAEKAILLSWPPLVNFTFIHTCPVYTVQ